MLIIFALAFLACEDVAYQPPTTCERLQGIWQGVTDQNHVYIFDAGHCVFVTVAEDATVKRQDFVYNCQGDTVNVWNLASNERRRMTAHFQSDSAAYLTAILPNGQDGIKIEIKLIQK